MLFVEIAQGIPGLVTVGEVLFAEIKKSTPFGIAYFVAPVAVLFMEFIILADKFLEFRFGYVDTVGLMENIDEEFG